MKCNHKQAKTKRRNNGQIKKMTVHQKQNKLQKAAMKSNHTQTIKRPKEEPTDSFSTIH